MKALNSGLLILLMFTVTLGCNDSEVIKQFEPGTISTASVEYSSTFSPSGEELYFARSEQKWASGNMKSTIYRSTRKNGSWSAPEVASFSGKYDDGDPHLSRDGNTLYFISTRPSEDSLVSADIWRVRKDAAGAWEAPERLPYPINSSGTEYGPRTDGDGNLYFASDRPGGYGQGDIYVSKKVNDSLSAPVNMGNTINSPTGEWNLEINGSGKLLIFEASQRPQNITGYGDLYISFKQGENWTLPQHMEELNTSGSDLFPYLPEAEDVLYYSSSDSLKGESTHIYYTDFKPLVAKYRAGARVPKKYLLTVNRSAHDLSLISLSNQQLIRRIPVGIGPHELSLSKDNKLAFVANYGSYPKPHEEAISSSQLEWVEEPQNTITRIDLTDFSTETFTIAGSEAHHGILTNVDGSVFWTTAENEAKLLELDGTSGEVLREYTTMPGSHILKANRDFSRIFVSNIASNTVSVIDREKDSITHISVPKGPEGLELSPDGQQLWVLCNSANKIVVLNTSTLEVIKTFDAEGKFPVKLAFINNEAWVANVFSKQISIFDASSFEFKGHIVLESTPLGITADNEQVFVSLPRKNTIEIYDPKTREKRGEFTQGMEQDGMVVINDVEGMIGE
ncbi:YVTN family beta-propeller repeat protein [Poritiphilus flavus]|uniref:YNCE-like beta-propeller domain-containing protein n=1 Tax=Poritiphilus flavus TaxID=2697053 RepID=A0A6L9EIE9_9FLAO|nr:PD40 domain-containing protein [Poritiphilus flavus]NAS14442.1 hypothetical protein [Poritiphilus flavus]